MLTESTWLRLPSLTKVMPSSAVSYNPRPYIPDSQYVVEFTGSYTIDEGVLAIVADPGPVPNICHLLPPSRLAQRPAWATPAISRSSSRFAERFDTVPHAEGLFARSPVAFTQSP